MTDNWLYYTNNEHEAPTIHARKNVCEIEELSVQLAVFVAIALSYLAAHQVPICVFLSHPLLFRWCYRYACLNTPM